MGRAGFPACQLAGVSSPASLSWRAGRRRNENGCVILVLTGAHRARIIPLREQDESFPPPPPPPWERPREPTAWDKFKKFLAPLGVVGVVIVKFFGKLKLAILPALMFLPAALKTGGTMLLSIGVYAMYWGVWYAVGFVLLILIHECGHLLAAQRLGLKVA